MAMTLLDVKSLVGSRTLAASFASQPQPFSQITEGRLEYEVLPIA